MAGAKSRLLPLSVPMRFFLAAAVFHLAFWLLLAAVAADLPEFVGGPGPILAALHLLTLGVFAMAAVGASLQLLPVATRHAAGAIWPCHLLSLLLIAGVPVLAWGMATIEQSAMLLGAGALAVGFVVYLILMADNLMSSLEFANVLPYTWAALACLVIFVALGLGLIVDYGADIFSGHRTVALLHALVAIFGFMGLLVIGFSYILIPMFALAGSVSDTRSLAVLGLALAAIFAGFVALLLDAAWLFLLAFAAGLATALLYGQIMRGLLKNGMRKRLGLSFLLIRVSWLLLPASLLFGAGLGAGLLPQDYWTLFFFLVLVGWLLTFLLGVLQRIVPFLASMHSARNGAPPVLLSQLTPERPLMLHAACHFIALSAVAIGIAIDHSELVRIGALAGALGGLCFLVFVIEILRRLAKHRRQVTA